ncbi:hypothetical protein [Streptosporangium carneum]|uniref:hypothetical protein n=1 Tax=Streptosporangium carneum TaxID=47481 RepID=UPI0022F2F968|nr:hypothetical protein [Streptosporangium carneum]
MSRKVVGTVAALLLVLLAVVHAPLQAPRDLHHEPGLAVTLAGGGVLPPALPHPESHGLLPPAIGQGPPTRATRAGLPRPCAPSVAQPVPGDSEPRAPPSGDLRRTDTEII